MNTQSTDVVIVGGGIVGVATAYLLGKAGINSVIIEKDSVGSHASGFAYGRLGRGVQPGPHTAIQSEGWKIHNEFARILPEETGVDIQFRHRSSLSLAFTDNEVSNLQDNLKLHQLNGEGNAHWVDAEGAKNIESRISPEIIGGIYSEEGADVEPYRLMIALVQASERVGATVRNDRVIGLKTKAGHVEGVLLEKGNLSCKNVVLAMGPWSGEASSWINLPLEVRPLKGQILRLQTDEEPFTCSLGWAGNYATSKPDGLLWAGTTEEEAGFDDTPTSDGRDKIMASLLKMIPSVTEARLAQHTACLRPVSSDGLLVLGKVPEIEGVYIATGAGRQGIVMGPAMARVITDLITKDSTSIPIDKFDPSRFAQSF